MNFAKKIDCLSKNYPINTSKDFNEFIESIDKTGLVEFDSTISIEQLTNCMRYLSYSYVKLFKKLILDNPTLLSLMKFKPVNMKSYNYYWYTIRYIGPDATNYELIIHDDELVIVHFLKGNIPYDKLISIKPVKKEITFWLKFACIQSINDVNILKNILNDPLTYIYYSKHPYDEKSNIKYLEILDKNCKINNTNLVSYDDYIKFAEKDGKKFIQKEICVPLFNLFAIYDYFKESELIIDIISTKWFCSYMKRIYPDTTSVIIDFRDYYFDNFRNLYTDEDWFNHYVEFGSKKIIVYLHNNGYLKKLLA